MRHDATVSGRSTAGRRRRRVPGFTMIEMVMVIAIMLFLLGVLIVVVGNVQMNAQRQATMHLIDAIESALVTFYEFNGCYPDLDKNSTDNTAYYTYDKGFGRAQCLYWNLTSAEKGHCMKDVPASATRTPMYKEGNSNMSPFLVDAWQNPIQVVLFDDDSKPSMQNGSMPLVYSVGPDGIGWDPEKDFDDMTDLAATLNTTASDHEDNLTNFRDLPVD